MAWPEGLPGLFPNIPNFRPSTRQSNVDIIEYCIDRGLIVGPCATGARILDELDAVEGLAGVMLTFDDFIIGMRNCGDRIQPLMTSRTPVSMTA
jgi:hypothetical protein